MEALPPEEWDFRPIERQFLQMAAEYEYLRSSNLAKPIRVWLNRSYQSTALAHEAHAVRILRGARLLKASADSPLGQFDAFMRNPPIDDERYHEAYEQKLEAAQLQIKTVAIFEGTVGEAIGRIFSHIDKIGLVEAALEALAKDLPTELVERHAQKIALRFERFPEPWLKILSSPGGKDYLTRRLERSTPNGKAFWDCINPLDHAEILQLVRLARLHEIIIDWSRSRDDIMHDFREWLDSAHPESRPGVRGEVGWLKRLSEYRLTRRGGMTYPKAIECVSQRKANHPGGASDTLPNSLNQSEWSRDVTTVERALETDFVAAIRKSFKDMSGYTPPDSLQRSGSLFVRSLAHDENKRVATTVLAGGRKKRTLPS